ncbi:hypothetical protein KJ836_01200 [Patescibacteria group bacterium]|nr:hypothetical protein [Patescibacteria group bacterium]
MSKPIITLGIIILLATALTVGVLAWSATLPCTQPASQQPVVGGEEIDTSDWLTYRNEEYGFEFKYPGDFYIKCITSITGECLPVTFHLCKKEIDKKSYCLSVSRAFKFGGDKAFDQYVIDEAKNSCAADGPMGSLYCDDVIEQEIIQVNNIIIYKVILEEVHEDYISDTTSKRTKNPIYMFRLNKMNHSDKSIKLLLLHDYDIPTKQLDYYQGILDSIVYTLKYIEK